MNFYSLGNHELMNTRGKTTQLKMFVSVRLTRGGFVIANIDCQLGWIQNNQGDKIA